MLNKLTRKNKLIIIIGAFFISVLLSLTLYKYLYAKSSGIDETIYVTALNEKNDVSWGTEVRINKIAINNIQIDNNTIELLDGWDLYEGNLIGAYNLSSPAMLSIKNNDIKMLEIQFVKQAGSGYVKIAVGDYEEIIDLYGEEGWVTYDWSHDFTSFSNFNIINNLPFFFMLFLFWICIIGIILYSNIDKEFIKHQRKIIYLFVFLFFQLIIYIPVRFRIFMNNTLCLELIAMIAIAVTLLAIANINPKKSRMYVCSVIVGAGVIAIISKYSVYSDYELAESHYFQLLFVMYLIWLITVTDLVEKLKKYVNEYNSKIYKCVTLLIYLVAPIIAFFTVEIISLSNIRGFSFIIIINNLVWYYMLFMLLFLILKNAKITCTLGCLFFYILGLVNYFVQSFRGSPILPADIYVLKTAVSVSGGYTYNLTTRIICATMIMLMYIVFIAKLENIKKKNTIKRNIRYVVLVGGITSAIIYTFFNTDYVKSLDLFLDQWNPAATYKEYGFALSYMANAKMLKVEKPAGYSVEDINLLYEEIDSLEDTSSSTQNEKPNIIAIMNESFSDLSVIGDLSTNEDYMPFIHALTENTIKGNTVVSVFAGRTSNSEFEFMTGNSMSYMPSGSVPYVQYINEDLPSLCNTLEDQGYASVAIHPFNPEGYRRNYVFKFFGFDRFLSIGDFKNPQLIRNFVSDKENYNMIIDEFENKEEGKPLFVLNITMQNHGGYATNYDFENKIKLVGDSNFPETEEYLSLIRESDKAFEYLVDYFSNVEEPTIILMFGDHQPGIEETFYETLYGKSLSELTLDELQKRYMTPFIIWANYDIKEEYIDAISLNYLSSYLLQIANIEMPAYNKFLLQLYNEFPVQNAYGYMDKEGNYYSLDTMEDSDLLLKYHMLQYNYMFDKKHRVDKFFKISK